MEKADPTDQGLHRKKCGDGNQPNHTGQREIRDSM
jgi:hypothetical protein